MYRRFHTKSSGNPSGKWQRVPHTGVGQLVREQLHDWEIELTHRTVGTAIRRDQYSVTIRRETPPYEEFLTGFASKAAALSAARRRIELLRSVRGSLQRGPHHSPPSRAPKQD